MSEETAGRRKWEAGRGGAKGGHHVAYTPAPGATAEGELAALASVYAFVIQAQEKKEAAASLDEDGREANPERRAGRGQ